MSSLRRTQAIWVLWQSKKASATLPRASQCGSGSFFQDAKGLWIGTSGRLRTLVYDSNQLDEAALPKSLKELADPKWKGMLGWAPSNSSFQAHVSALRHIWGEEETQTWLEGVQANAPAVYPKNSPQVKAADAGQLKIGWVNHYYLHKLGKTDTAATLLISAAGRRQHRHAGWCWCHHTQHTQG